MRKIYLIVLIFIPFFLNAQNTSPFVFTYDTLNTSVVVESFSLSTNNQHYPCFDFNADGNLDILMCNYSTFCSLYLFLGKGDGRFMTPIKIYRDNIEFVNPEHIGDFNKDKLPDILLHKRSNKGDTLWVLMNNGNGTFMETAKVRVPEIQLKQLCVADVNNDGKSDIVGAGYLYFGNGDGTFASAFKYCNKTYADAIIASDFNGDNNVDIAEVNTDSIRTFQGNGDGSFAKYKAMKLGFTNIESWETADFNGDGNIDFTICDMSHYLKIFISNGDGSFTMKTDGNKIRNSYEMVTRADIDGDGKMDLIKSSDSISWLKGNGDGTFGRIKHLPYAIMSMTTFDAPPAIGDFNNDGKTDFVIVKSMGTPFYHYYMSVLLNKSEFEAPVAINATQKYKEYAVLFQWTNYKNVFSTGLIIEIASDEKFKNILKTETKNYQFLNDTMEYVFPYVSGIKEYYCRVKAFNANDTSEFSNVFHLSLTQTDVKSVNSEYVEIFPNPAVDFVTIRTKNSSRIEIFSIQGKLMLNETIDSECKIDVKSWEKGVYNIRVIRNGSLYCKKFILQ